MVKDYALATKSITFNPESPDWGEVIPDFTPIWYEENGVLTFCCELDTALRIKGMRLHLFAEFDGQDLIECRYCGVIESGRLIYSASHRKHILSAVSLPGELDSVRSWLEQQSATEFATTIRAHVKKDFPLGRCGEGLRNTNGHAENTCPN